MCVGNICRSPVAERLLAARCPDMRVESAGLAAVVGHGVDKDAAKVAIAHGVSVEGHCARQFTPNIGGYFDLILVMEAGHRREIERLAPQLSGRTMLFGQWSAQNVIPDPYRKSTEFHEAVFSMLEIAADGWAEKLIGTPND